MRSQWQQCLTDEHYFATVLAVAGRDDETDCAARLISADWSARGIHPDSFSAENVTVDLCAVHDSCTPKLANPVGSLALAFPVAASALLHPWR